MSKTNENENEDRVARRDRDEEERRQEGYTADDETTPLFRNHDYSSSTTTRYDSTTKSKSRFSISIPIRLPIADETLVPVVSMLIVFFNEAEFYVKQAPMVRAIEAMACVEYYAAQDNSLANLGKLIPERLCKKTLIHERVAAIYGVLYGVRMLSSVVGTLALMNLLKTGPRRMINVLHKSSLLVSNACILIGYLSYPRLPIWFVCLSGFATLFGANLDLSLSAMFGAYADVISDPARRSNLIFMTNSMQYLAQFLCLPLAGWMMNLNGEGNTPEVALWAALGCVTMSFILTVFFFPETYREDRNEDDGNDGRIKRSPSTSSTDTDSDCSDEQTALKKPDRKSKDSSAKPFGIVFREFGFTRMTLLLSSMLFSVTSTRIIDWYGLLQFPSIKFEWMLSQTTYLVCFQGVITFLVFVFVLPAINSVSQTYLGISARQTSIRMILCSSVLIAISSTMFGLASAGVREFIVGVVIYTFGSGITSALQTYTVSVSSSSRVSGAALTVLSLSTVGGKFLSSALWPVLLSIGLSSPGQVLAGLPFFVAAVLAVLSAVTVVLADWTGWKWRVGEDGEEEV